MDSEMCLTFSQICTMSSEEINRRVIFNESNGHYEWIIPNFSDVTHAFGDSITSEEFTCTTPFCNSYTKWEIELHPNGSCRKNKGVVICTLRSLNNYEIKVDAEIITKMKENVEFNRTVNHNFEKKLSSFTVALFSRHFHTYIIKSTDDSLTVSLKINSIKSYDVPYHKDNLLKDISSLLKANEHCSDVALVSSDGTEHRAHKAILSCRSKVFSAMFQHDMLESRDNRVTIKDTDAETVKSMLEFMYTGNVRHLNVDQAKKLYSVSDKYDLSDLREVCMNTLIHQVNADNTLDLLEFACIFDCPGLKSVTKSYFFQQQPIFIEPEYIERLPKPVLDELLSGDQNNVEEDAEKESSVSEDILTSKDNEDTLTSRINDCSFTCSVDHAILTSGVNDDALTSTVNDCILTSDVNDCILTSNVNDDSLTSRVNDYTLTSNVNDDNLISRINDYTLISRVTSDTVAKVDTLICKYFEDTP